MLNKISKAWPYRLKMFLDTHPIGQIFQIGQKKAVWKKVSELKTGIKIAIESDGKLEWDEIIEIKSVGRERVYDIEVEDTHNFVGNGIIAHNTNLSLTDTGDVILIGDSPSNYEVATSTGITTRIGAFAQATVAKLKAGIGSFRQVETNLISPVANADLIIDLQPDNSQTATQLVIKGENDEVVTSFDAKGNATISGTLYAGNIESSRLNEIENLLAEVENNQTLLTEAANWNTNTATSSANFSELIASNLFVTGNASITSLFVSDNFTTKNINSLTEPLSIQSLASAPLEIMAGKIIIDTDGNTRFLGNVEIAGNIKLDGNIIIANDIDPIATESAVVIEGEINTNATAGKAMISAGLTELKIINPKTNVNTLVYVTPVTSTQNKVLYVKSKDVGEFTIGFNEAIDTDVEFNWWIIELSDQIVN